MAKVRLIAPEERRVPWLGRTVQPDEVVDVPDRQFDAYVCQAGTWQAVEEPKPPAVEVAAETKPAPRRRSGKDGD